MTWHFLIQVKWRPTYVFRHFFIPIAVAIVVAAKTVSIQVVVKITFPAILSNHDITGATCEKTRDTWPTGNMPGIGGPPLLAKVCYKK